MKTLLTIALVAVLAAEAVLFYRMQKLIGSWGKEVEEHNISLTDEEQRRVEHWGNLMSGLSTAAVILFLLRFVVFDMFPLIGG